MGKWFTYALGGILLTQLITEMLPLLFSVGSFGEQYAYYIPMRLFSIGVFPSIIIFYFCKNRVENVLGLTLVLSQSFWALRELISMFEGFEWLVLAVSSIDVCWFIFTILPLILSIITDAVSNRHNGGRDRLSILLSRHSKGAKDNCRNTNTDE